MFFPFPVSLTPKFIRFLLLSIIGILAASPCLAFEPDVTVEVDVPRVTMSWPELGESYQQALGAVGPEPVVIERRELGLRGVDTWDQLARIIDGSTSFVDNDLVTGKTYEYRIWSDIAEDRTNAGNSMGFFPVTLNTPYTDKRDNIESGTGAAVVFVVEDTWAADIEQELKLMENTMAGDGWQVFRIDWGREGVGSEEGLKAAIKALVDANPQISNVYLFGTIPVVFSGHLANDGHEPRPMETDLFYADLDTWTDVLDSSWKVAGDGIYDHDTPPTVPELGVGRVSFHNMTMFKKTELEYLRDYIHKDFAYRHGYRYVPYRAYLGDGLQGGVNRQIMPIVGRANWEDSGNLTVTVDSDEGYLFAFGNHSNDAPLGWYPGIDSRYKGIFMSVFRSWQQEFWVDNAQMRRVMTQPDWGLTSTWGARPLWTWHLLAAGQPIGDLALLSWENVFGYMRIGTDGLWYDEREYCHLSEVYKNYVTQNLLGDPTLRVFHIDPVENLTISRLDSDTVQLDWDASPVADLVGYHVYASTERLGPYTRLTSSVLTGTSYTASAPTGADLYFQVRTRGNAHVNTGVYEDQSLGRFALAYADGSVNTVPVATDFPLSGKVNTPQLIEFPETDADGDPLIPVFVHNPEGGQIRWFHGKPYYVSKRDTVGTETASYVLFDGVSTSEAATITFESTELGDVLVGWEFPNASIDPIEPTFLRSGVTAGALTAGAGVTVEKKWDGDDGYTAKYFGSSLVEANNDYFYWTVSAAAGSLISMDRIQFSVNGNVDDPVYYEMRVSVDGFETYETVPLEQGAIIGTGYSSNDGFLDTGDLSGIAIAQEQWQEVEFRLYMWHTGYASDPLGLGKITDIQPDNFPSEWYDAIEDFSIFGSVTSSTGAPLILLTKSELTVEEYDSDTIGVGLSAAPESPVTLNLSVTSSTTDNIVVTTEDSLIFDSTNWSQLRYLSFSAEYDENDTSGQVVYSISADGLDAVALTVNETDVGTVTTEIDIEVFGEIVSYTPAVYDSSQTDTGVATIYRREELEIAGNGWFMLDLTNIDIDEDTMLSFDFQSDGEPEINAVGFETNTSYTVGLFFQFWGTQNWNANWIEDYGATSPGVKHYEIPVGATYTGTYRYLTFINDDDVAKTAVSTYSNIRIYQRSPMTDWASARGVTESMSVDSNGDGRVNLFHFAFDTNPFGNGSHEGKAIHTVTDDVVDGQTYVYLTFPVRLGASFSGDPLESDPVDGLIYRVVSATDLKALAPDIAVEEITPVLSDGLPTLGDYDDVLGSDWEYRSFRMSLPIGTYERGFIWVEVDESAGR